MVFGLIAAGIAAAAAVGSAASKAAAAADADRKRKERFQTSQERYGQLMQASNQQVGGMYDETQQQTAQVAQDRAQQQAMNVARGAGTAGSQASAMRAAQQQMPQAATAAELAGHQAAQARTGRVLQGAQVGQAQFAQQMAEDAGDQEAIWGNVGGAIQDVGSLAGGGAQAGMLASDERTKMMVAPTLSDERAKQEAYRRGLSDGQAGAGGGTDDPMRASEFDRGFDQYKAMRAAAMPGEEDPYYGSGAPDRLKAIDDWAGDRFRAMHVRQGVKAPDINYQTPLPASDERTKAFNRKVGRTIPAGADVMSDDRAKTSMGRAPNIEIGGPSDASRARALEAKLSPVTSYSDQDRERWRREAADVRGGMTNAPTGGGFWDRPKGPTQYRPPEGRLTVSDERSKQQLADVQQELAQEKEMSRLFLTRLQRSNDPEFGARPDRGSVEPAPPPGQPLTPPEPPPGAQLEEEVIEPPMTSRYYDTPQQPQEEVLDIDAAPWPQPPQPKVTSDERAKRAAFQQGMRAGAERTAGVGDRGLAGAGPHYEMHERAPRQRGGPDRQTQRFWEKAGNAYQRTKPRRGVNRGSTSYYEGPLQSRVFRPQIETEKVKQHRAKRAAEDEAARKAMAEVASEQHAERFAAHMAGKKKSTAAKGRGGKAAPKRKGKTTVEHVRARPAPVKPMQFVPAMDVSAYKEKGLDTAEVADRIRAAAQKAPRFREEIRRKQAARERARRLQEIYDPYQADVAMFGTSSDRRGKNVFGEGPASEMVENTEGSFYEYKPEFQGQPGTEPGVQYGIMAQDLEESPVGQTLVDEDENGMKRVDTERLSMVNTAALNEILDRVKRLEGRGKRRK